MNELQQLLERWAELEPEECKNVPGWADEWFIGPKDDTHKRRVETLMSKDAIQGAVQEAIEARGWIWQILHFNGTWRGRIADINEWIRADSDTSPAHALLACYIEAIEQTQEVHDANR